MTYRPPCPSRRASGAKISLRRCGLPEAEVSARPDGRAAPAGETGTRFRPRGVAMRTVVIMGAGGRDFHDFNTVFRADPEARVAAFTASQIPGIENRAY